MASYNWMTQYTPQTEWIERRGVLLWLAFFFIELGAGIFFVASFFTNISAMIAGWLICSVLGGGFHVAFLGKPLRFWRMAISSGWTTSWISRGLIFVSMFLLLGLIHIVLAQWMNSSTALLVTANIFAFLTIIYGGFAMNYVNGIPLWNTALLPILYLISGLWGGAEVTLGIILAGGDSSIAHGVEEWIRILLIGFIILIPIYLISIRYTSAAGQVSVRYMVLGKHAPLFWIAVVIIGMVIPLSAVISSFLYGFNSIPLFLLYIAIVCGLIGDLVMRYLILRCGLYAPLVSFSSLPTTV